MTKTLSEKTPDAKLLDLAMKSAGSLSPLKHLMLSCNWLICNSSDWCILVLAIFSEIFLLLLTLLTLVQLCIFLGVSKTKPLKKGSQKLAPCKYHRLLVITIFKVQLKCLESQDHGIKSKA